MPEIATIALTATPPKDTVRAALDDPAVFALLITHARAVTRDLDLDHENLVHTVFQRAWAKRAVDLTVIPVTSYYQTHPEQSHGHEAVKD